MNLHHQEILRLVGRNVRLVRLSRKLSLSAFAKLVGIDKGDISKIEAGKIDIRLTTLEKIYVTLAIPIEVLFVE